MSDKRMDKDSILNQHAATESKLTQLTGETGTETSIDEEVKNLEV
jgi:hypothetical protein